MTRRGEPYWSDVKVGLEILEPGEASPRAVTLVRPYGVIGRFDDADVRFDDRSVSARHAYLHADARGLFVVDLATRNGIRFDGNFAPCGWLRPGEAVEIAGRLIRLASLEVDGRDVAPPPCAVNPLADSGEVPLCDLSLEPVGRNGVSWALGSELIFVGRGDSCGIRLNQANVARTHCALYRTSIAAYVVNLPGQPTLVNGRPIRDAAVLTDGDVIAIGQARFIARLTSLDPSHPSAATPGREIERIPHHHQPPAKVANLPSIKDLGGLPGLDGRSFPLELIPPESREAVLGWMLGTLHAGQSEILRRQDDLQRSVALILQHLQTDTSKRLDSQSDRIEALAGELSRLASSAKAAVPSTSPQLILPHLPPDPPRRPARDLPPAPEVDPARSLETAAWLLERIDRVGNENKFSFRSFLARRTPRKDDLPPPPDAHPSNQSPETGVNGTGNGEGV